MEFAARVALSDHQCCNREKREAKSTARLRIAKRDPCCHQAEGCDQHTVPSVKLHDGIAAEPRLGMYPPEQTCDYGPRNPTINHDFHVRLAIGSATPHYEQFGERVQQHERYRTVDRRSAQNKGGAS